MARRKIVAGNWKMNGSKESIQQLLSELVVHENADVIVASPALYLDYVQALAPKGILVAAQNVSDQDSGAFTGEISVAMLQDLQVSYSLVGHSERRSLYAEDDAFIAAKVAKLLEAKMTPILCIGETLAEREAGDTFAVCQSQLQAVIDVVGIDAFSDIVIAYEPVWAIGTGKSATSEQAQEVHADIRQFLANESAVVAEKVQILYGGSVKASNSAELFAQPDIDGALVGGASLVATEFNAIIEAAK